MSIEYDDYLAKHKANVAKAFEWLENNLPQLAERDNTRWANARWSCTFGHDASKSQDDEYKPYDAYFYGGNRSYKVVQDYNFAWLLHLHRNPHHWQYWVLINDDPKEGERILEIPYEYIIEMICDWWSFSWSDGNLYEIFKWYDEHRYYIKLGKVTRKHVEIILDAIGNKLDELAANETDELQHHGTKGMKWGVKNGPPYPIDKSKKFDKMSLKINDRKLLNYALDPDKDPDKATAFKLALGYTKDNYKDLLNNVIDHFDSDQLIEKGNDGFGMKYQQLMKLKGPNGKNANVLTAWIEDGEELRLITLYVTNKEA